MAPPRRSARRSRATRCGIWPRKPNTIEMASACSSTRMVHTVRAPLELLRVRVANGVRVLVAVGHVRHPAVHDQDGQPEAHVVQYVHERGDVAQAGGVRPEERAALAGQRRRHDVGDPSRGVRADGVAPSIAGVLARARPFLSMPLLCLSVELDHGGPAERVRARTSGRASGPLRPSSMTGRCAGAYPASGLSRPRTRATPRARARARARPPTRARARAHTLANSEPGVGEQGLGRSGASRPRRPRPPALAAASSSSAAFSSAHAPATAAGAPSAAAVAAPGRARRRLVCVSRRCGGARARSAPDGRVQVCVCGTCA